MSPPTAKLPIGPPHRAISHFTYIRGLIIHRPRHEQTSYGVISPYLCSHGRCFEKFLSTQSSNVIYTIKGQAHASRRRNHHGYQPGIYKPTKSDMLIASLGNELSSKYLEPEGSGRVDLSFQDPRTIITHGRKVFKTSKTLAASLIVDRKISLITFLSFYIMYLDPIIPSPEDIYSANCSYKLKVYTRKFLNDKNFTWLHERGYDITDLTAWRWILSAESSEVCAARLMVSTKNQRPGFIAGRIPVFLILFLLRRQDINGPALRLFLIFIWNRLLEQEAFETKVRLGEISVTSPIASSKEMGEFLIFDEHSTIILIVRLLRHARKVWPQALPSIAALAARYLGRATLTTESSPTTRPSSPYSRDSSSNTTSDPNPAKWSFLFNTFLSLLALPSSKHPLQSIIFHEQAQFSIIRKMTEYKPALVIDRRGYRALARVQIARKKTPSEREWARLKLKSWPPWRRIETGRDMDVSMEQGISRAAEIIMRSEEAGYAELDWERDAKVFTGWDTDKSPTIQTRTLFSRPSRSRLLSDSNDDDASLWCARITATRTAPEAWACFIAYQDTQKRSKTRLSQPPYFAMFEKIIFEEKRHYLDPVKPMQKAGEHNPLPGDGKETWQIPGPQEAIYVRAPVPDRDEFFQMMLKDKIVPGPRFLEFLLRYAKTLKSGTEYLEASSLPAGIKRALIEDPPSAEICNVDVKIFTAYIGYLCQHALTSRQLRAQPDDSTPLEHAFRLMDLRQPSYWVPWSFLLLALSRNSIVVDSDLYGLNATVQDSLAWSVMCHWLHRMRSVHLDLGFECFHRLCRGLEKATCASGKLLQQLRLGNFFYTGGREGQISPSEKLERLAIIKQNAERVLADGPSILKCCFEELVAVGNAPNPLRSSDSPCESEMSDAHPTTLLPMLNEVPHPVNLHAYIRVLGLYHDYEGILKVVQWMDRFAKAIHIQSSEYMNGGRAMRTLITAVRVFVEGSWPFDDDPVKDLGGTTQLLEAAPEDILHKVSEIIKKQELWGGWASDDEVDLYIQRHVDD
jgi:hypothetical protein